MTLEPTPENLRNIKVGDTLLCGVDKESVCRWVVKSTKSFDDGIRINGWGYVYACAGKYILYEPAPLDIQGIIKAVEIPEGFTPYDPNVLPPDGALELEVMCTTGVFNKNPAEYFTREWNTYNITRSPYERIAYRVTKWEDKKVDLDFLAEQVALDIDLGEPMLLIKEKLLDFAQAIIEEARKPCQTK